MFAAHSWRHQRIAKVTLVKSRLKVRRLTCNLGLQLLGLPNFSRLFSAKFQSNQAVRRLDGVQLDKTDLPQMRLDFLSELRSPHFKVHTSKSETTSSNGVETIKMIAQD